MHFTALVWKNLIRRPLRSALSLLAMATAIAAVISLLGISQGFTRSFGEIYTAHAVDIVVSRAGSADRLSSSIDQTFAVQMAQLPEVQRSAPVLLETLSLESEGIYGIPSMGIAPDSWLRDDYEISSGINNQIETQTGSHIDLAIDQSDTLGMQASRLNQPTQEENNRVWLGVNLAERLGVAAGGEVILFDEAYQVTAVFKSPSTWENGAMIFDLAQLQNLTDRPGQATYINVVLAPPPPGSSLHERSQQAIAGIRALDNKLQPLATQEFVTTDTRMQIASAMAWMTSAIALIIGTIGTLNTMLTSVIERTQEIGVLRAIGWPQRRVVRMIVMESCGLTVVASIFGTLLAIALTWGLSQAPIVKGVLSPVIDMRVILQGWGLAICIGLLGAILPAWRAARMLPTEAFRHI